MFSSMRIRFVLLSFLMTLAACSTPAPIASTPPPPTLAVALPTVVPSDKPTEIGASVTKDLDSFFDKFRKASGFSGIVLIARSGQVLYEKGFGETWSTPQSPLTPSTKFRIASVSKQFTAAAILKLQADGELNVQDMVCRYIKPCPNGWEQLKLHHLLTHTSGIAADYGASPLNTESDFDLKFHSPQALVARYGEIPLKFKPGAVFSYGNGGYITLAAIIEQISGTSYEIFLRKNILDPLGMKDTGITIDDAQLAGEPLRWDFSNAVGAGTLYSTAQDLYRWAQQLDSWQSNPKSDYQAMFQPHTPADDPGSMYGYGLRIEKLADQPRIGHGGLATGPGDAGYGALVERYPNSGLTIIVLSNHPYAPDDLGPLLAKIALGIN